MATDKNPWATVNLYTDGGTRGNPGRGAWAFLVTDKKGNEIHTDSGTLDGLVTNNESEYTAIIKGMKKCIEMGATRIRVFSDSELVVKQLNGQNRLKSDKLRKYHHALTSLRTPVTFNWLNRENPMIRQCDAMAARVLDGR